MNAARMQPGPRAIAPPWAIVLLACALAACCGWGLGVAPARAAAAGTPATSTPDKRIRAWSDRELATAEHRLDLEAQGVGNSLLMADERRHEAGRERDAAFQLLSRWMAVSYRDASSQSAITSLLSGGNLRQLSERVRLARTLTRYHDGLVTSLDEAEASLQLTALERTRLVQQLTAAQHELAGVRAEQARRAALVAGQRERREAAAAAAQRAVAAVAAPPGTLVAGAGGGVAAMLPMGAAPSGPVSAQSIDAYLAAKGSPMAGNGAAFVASGARYRIDPRLIVAISGAESNFGQITCGPNNAWGWACPNDPEDFATWAHGIETITRGLRIGYFDEGRSSVVLIQQKYAPSGAANDPTGLNNHWVNNVTKFLLEQGGNPNAVGDGPSSLPLPDLGGLGIVAGD